ncbi:class I fructose-bisphosphate aldolase family protein [candidate division KSB1 bacterium]
MTGKEINLDRIMDRETGKTVIIPMDHGVTVGPIKGLVDMSCAVEKVTQGGANAVVLHKGMVGKGYRGKKGKEDIGLIVHLSASTGLSPDPNYKVLVCSPEEARGYGADAVSIHVNVGAEREAEMLRDFGRVSYECKTLGIPLLAMMYARGPKVDELESVEYIQRTEDIDEKKAEEIVKQNKVNNIKLAARVGAELGADIIKCPYTGDPESFREVVDGCSGVPVVIAGGSKLSDEQTLEMVYGAVKAGAAGLSMGRNAFQHENPSKLVQAACSIVHDGRDVEYAMKILKGIEEK